MPSAACRPPTNRRPRKSGSATGIEQITLDRGAGHLKDELAAMANLKVIVALGAIAHQALLLAYGIKARSLVFGHNVSHELPDGRLLVDSYHCSGYNWRTGRLTRDSFEAVFAGVRARLG